MNSRALLTIAAVAMCVGLTWWLTSQTEMIMEKANPQMVEKKDVKIEPPVPKEATDAQPKLTLEESLTGPELEVMRQIYLRFNAGDFGTALKQADAASADESLGPKFNEWLRKQLPAILLSAGWMDIKLDNCADAVPTLRRALALNQEPLAAKGLAFCHFKNKNFASADEFFSFYLEKQPADLEMSLLYADLLESQSRFDQAADILNQASIKSPENDPLKQRLSSMRKKSKEGLNQTTVTSTHISLTYNVEDHSEVVDFVLATLEEAIADLTSRLNFQPPKNLIEVVLYSDDSFRSIMDYGPSWAEGLFDGRMRIPVKTGAENKDKSGLERVLVHELVHALLAGMTNLREIPSWFNEGLAQRLACADRCNKAIFGATPGKFLSAESLLVPYTAYEVLKADRSYRQSLYLIYLIEADEEFGGSEAISKIVGRISPTGDLSSDGILSPLNITFSDLHKKAESLWARRQLL